MKSLRWVAVLIILAFCGQLSFADVVPVDGGIGLKHDGHSTPITSLTQTLTFSPCAGAPPLSDVAFDCGLFGGAQAIFAGVNETGFAFNTIAITFSGYNQTLDPVVNCDGGSVFQTCSHNASGTNLTVTFFQGTGTGVGCFGNASTDAACLINSTVAALSNEFLGTNLPYSIFPTQSTGPCQPPEDFPPGAVCGTDGFVVAMGYNGKPFNQPLSLQAQFFADGAAPEPPTLVLFGSGMLAMLLFGIKTARLA